MSSSLAGSTIGRFRVDRLLGRGGMGAVYAAFDEKLERDVALKVLHEDGEAPAQRKRLMREARIAAKLQHPNIATIYEVDELEGNLFIVMELLEGRSLRQVLAERRIGMEEAIGIARDMARGLARAHVSGVVHRDIKPENIFLATLGHDTTLTKVLDFGLARQKPQPVPGVARTEHTSTNTTSRGDMWGTPGYVSPEQALGQSVDARTDVFSFGVVVYEMLANIRPFRGDSAVATMIATTRAEPRPLADIVPNLPPAIGDIVKRCLEKRREDRYPDAGELSVALENFARGGSASMSARMPILGSSPSIPHLSTAASFAPVPEAPTTGSAAISMTTREETIAAIEERRRDRVKLFAAITIGFALALMSIAVFILMGAGGPKKTAAADDAAATIAPPTPVVAPVAAKAEEPPPSEPPPAPAEEVPASDASVGAASSVAAAPAPAPRPSPAAPVGSGKKKRPADCAQPFVIDSKGVKIPKLYCL